MKNLILPKLIGAIERLFPLAPISMKLVFDVEETDWATWVIRIHTKLDADQAMEKLDQLDSEISYPPTFCVTLEFD